MSAPASSCDATTRTTHDQVALMMFAEVNGARESDVVGAVHQGVGGIFISTAAVPLLQAQAFKTDVARSSNQPLVAIDEEGGRVQRLRNLIGPMPSGRAMHATMSPSQIMAMAQRHGSAMRQLGITMNFAPDADVSDEPDDAVIGDRSFANDPDAVTTDAVAFAQGMASAGVTPVLKHFPGHGHGSGDSHTGLVTTPSLGVLEGDDLIPFRNAPTKVPSAAIMVGHLIVPGLTNGLPASVSRDAITGLLRNQLGFNGLVITDDLGAMRGILDQFHTPVDAAVAAIAAGADMALIPADDVSATISSVESALTAGKISRAQIATSATRVLRALPNATCH